MQINERVGLKENYRNY